MSEEQTTTARLGQDETANTDATSSAEFTNTSSETIDTDATQDNVAHPLDDENNGASNEFYGAPETYDFKDLKLPKGAEVDMALVEKFAPLGKELNLSQQGANKLANFFATIQEEQLAEADKHIAEYKKQEKEATKLSYEKLLNTDAEIGGGDRDKMNAYLDVADIGYNAFASSELIAILHDLQLDYHPAVIKHFHRLGKLCGNDKITKTNAPTGTQQSAAEILYGSKSE